MFSLFVSHAAEDHRGGVLEMPRDRYLEHTKDEISSQLRSLSVEARDCLASWPCVLMQEGRAQERVVLGQIAVLDASAIDVKVRFSPLSGAPDLINDVLWKLRVELDIGQFEFSRNHWAIKDRDLFQVLTKAGYSFDGTVDRTFANSALPAPTRSDLMKARDRISEWSHTKIDDLLLEASVAGLEAGRELGSRRDRANAITKFAIANPAANTAENHMLSAFLVQVADLPSTESETVVAGDSASDLWSPNHASASVSRAVANRVFVVHGRDSSARDDLVMFMRGVGLEPIVLHEQPNMGRHLLTKFIDEAELVTFAVVLMTDDEVGGLKGANLSPRARQNVILELGYFLAHLGQARVCALITPGLDTPSDFDGIVYIEMDPAGKWQAVLRRELAAAELPLSG